MRGTRSTLQNLSLLTFGQVSSQLLNVWALVFLAGYLGAHWFGVVMIGVAFMGYALVAAEWGMFSLGIREISRLNEPQEILRYSRSHTGLLSMQALGVFGLGLLILSHLPFYRNDPWVFVLYLAMVLPQIFQHFWVAIGVERMALVGTGKFLRSLVYALAILFLLKPLANLENFPTHRWVPLFFMTAMLCENLVFAGIFRRWFGGFIWPALPRWEETRRRWQEALPIGASNVILRILLNIDLIMIGLLAEPATAGNYAAASRVIFLMVVAIEVLWNALLPRLSRLAKLDPAAYRRSFNLYLGFVIAGLLPIGVGGCLVGPDLMTMLYKGEFGEASGVFQNLAISYSFLALAMYLGNSLVARDRQRAYFWPLLVSAVVAVIGNAVWVPLHGAVGASWGMMTAHIILAVALGFINRFQFLPSLGVLVLLLIPGLGAMFWLVDYHSGWHVVLRIVAGGGAYLALVAFPLRWFLQRNQVSRR